MVSYRHGFNLNGSVCSFYQKYTRRVECIICQIAIEYVNVCLVRGELTMVVVAQAFAVAIAIDYPAASYSTTASVLALFASLWRLLEKSGGCSLHCSSSSSSISVLRFVTEFYLHLRSCSCHAIRAHFVHWGRCCTHPPSLSLFRITSSSLLE